MKIRPVGSFLAQPGPAHRNHESFVNVARLHGGAPYSSGVAMHSPRPAQLRQETVLVSGSFDRSITCWQVSIDGSLHEQRRFVDHGCDVCAAENVAHKGVVTSLASFEARSHKTPMLVSGSEDWSIK
eukprot:COSAG04_NODE_15191_length_540_cov_0.843537_1_plen_126_part_01